MNIENDIKLDFSDVLIRPKRSNLKSRSEVELIKEFKPKYGKPFSGVPIISSNMATGSFSMLKVFTEHKMFVAIAKHNSHLWTEEYGKDRSVVDYGFYTIGMSDDELAELHKFALSVGDRYEDVKICVDIANGYTQNFADFVANVRKTFPNNVIVAGNVATAEMTQQLIIAGADYVKCGIGGGCFSGNMEVKTTNGNKKIKDIVNGDIVLSHTGSEKEVINTIKYYHSGEIFVINDIECTPSHEFYVVHVDNIDKINEDNISKYAMWVRADELDDSYMLIELV